jgi:hypothetical protein
MTDQTAEELQKEVDELRAKEKQEKRKQADQLVDLALAGAALFHTPDNTGFADIDLVAHRETWPIRSKGFKRWLARQFFEQTNGAPNSEALQSALNVIEAKGHFDGPMLDVNVRVAGLDGKIYLDLADPTWRAVEIDETGWRVVDRPPVRFRRSSGMLALPEPRQGGDVAALKGFLNLANDRDFVLVVAWLATALRNHGPYPVLVLAGEQGSAKSTLSSILRWLIDPNSAPLRALPREDRDLFIAANNGHVLSFDNVSGLPTWISDTLCRLATGGGFAVRQLYTDQDEILFDAQRPIILNGIEEVVTRPDLADRAIFLNLEPIPEKKRRQEAEIMSELKAALPDILGGLLDAMAHGLKHLPTTHLSTLPRMADFAIWATACEGALWEPGTFAKAYKANIAGAIESVIDADMVSDAVRDFMEKRDGWQGSAKDLLGALADQVGDKLSRQKAWPQTPRALAGRLTRAAPVLRKIGILVKRGERTMAARQIVIDKVGFQPSLPSSPSFAVGNKDLGHDGRHDGRATHDGRPTRTVMDKPLNGNGYDGHDDHDGRFPTYSAEPCQACDGLGCPTCQPRAYGIGGSA